MVKKQKVSANNVHGFDILQVYVARRPMRHGGLRFEKDICEPNIPLIHCYGAGPSGFKISWGVAKRVERLVFDIIHGHE